LNRWHFTNFSFTFWLKTLFRPYKTDCKDTNYFRKHNNRACFFIDYPPFSCFFERSETRPKHIFSYNFSYTIRKINSKAIQTLIIKIIAQATRDIIPEFREPRICPIFAMEKQNLPP